MILLQFFCSFKKVWETFCSVGRSKWFLKKSHFIDQLRIGVSSAQGLLLLLGTVVASQNGNL